MARMRTRKHKLTRHAYSTTTIAAYVMSWRQHKWRRQVASGSTKPTFHAIMQSVLPTSNGKRTETIPLMLKVMKLKKSKNEDALLFSKMRENRQSPAVSYDISSIVSAYDMSWRQHMWRRQVASGSTKPTIHAIMQSVLPTSNGQRTETIKLMLKVIKLETNVKSRTHCYFLKGANAANRQQFHTIFHVLCTHRAAGAPRR